MPSPFVGMDPYLEGSEWTSVHVELSSEIARQLAPKLRPKYIVRTMRRFVTELPETVSISTGDIYPDVGLAVAPSGGATPAPSIALDPAPLELTTIMPTSIPDITIEIRDVKERELITAIELLSPANKRGEGYQTYLRKRHQILLSRTHLVEIDLLRRGRRVPMHEPLPDAPYFIFVSRASTRPITQVWPLHLQTKLPSFPIPLLAEDGDVTLDLQAAFCTVYDALGYDLSVDYTKPPEVAVSTNERSWLARQLDDAGIRRDTQSWRELN